MKTRFTLFRRGQVFYCQDSTTGQQSSLRTKDEAEAHALLHSKNEAFRQPVLNLQIARTYLTASDPETASRPWQTVMDEMGKTKHGPTKIRHDRLLASRWLSDRHRVTHCGKQRPAPKPYASTRRA